MTETATDQQRIEAAAQSVAAKLQAFHDGLAPDERQVFVLALQAIAPGASEATEDTGGHMLPGGQPPLAAVAAVQQLAVAEVIRTVLGLFRVS